MKKRFIQVELAIATGTDHGPWYTVIVLIPASYSNKSDLVMTDAATKVWRKTNPVDKHSDEQHFWIYHYNPDELYDEKGRMVND